MHFTSTEDEGSAPECCPGMVDVIQRSVRSDGQLQVKHYAPKFHCGHCWWMMGCRKEDLRGKGTNGGLFQ